MSEKTIYFIGIKGVGMSALAIVAKGKGYTVLGSDVAEEFITDKSLADNQISVNQGFAAEHITGVIDQVIVGASISDTNPELVAAKSLQLPCLTYSEFLGYLAGQQKTIAVAGTHGKTTTTALVSYLLQKAGFDPSYIIGTGSVVGLANHGQAGRGDYFITEADDYKRAVNDPQPKFLDLSPYAAIITSIEHDHPDLYPSLRDCLEAFYQFTLKVSSAGFIVVSSDDPTIKKLRSRIADRRFISYGFEASADYQIKLSRTKLGEKPRFRLLHEGQALGLFQLQLVGEHNIYNAAAAIVMALELGVSLETIVNHLPNFVGLERRFQILGTVGQRIIIDDYAHHPTAISSTIAAAKQQYKHYPIWVFFQPHTYSRTKALLKEFGQAFGQADRVIITDIFASARETVVTIDAQTLVTEIGQHHNNVSYVPKSGLADFIKDKTPEHAIILLMGAGDIYKIGRNYVNSQP